MGIALARAVREPQRRAVASVGAGNAKNGKIQPMNHPLNELLVLIRSRMALIQVSTLEESSIVSFLTGATRGGPWPLLEWSVAGGLRRLPERESVWGTQSFADALRHINAEGKSGVYVLLDVAPYLQDPLILRLLKEIAQGYDANPRTLVLLGANIELPQELARLSARFVPKLPDLARIRDIYLEEAYRWLREQPGRRIQRSEDTEEMLLQNLRGVCEEDVRHLVTSAIRDDGRITLEDVDRVIEFKRNSLSQKGLTEFFANTDSFAHVGGLKHLKSWLEKRRAAFVSNEQRLGVDAPKGMLLLGVQGSGKSLAAKSVAGSWHVPLIRLDLGAVYNKYLGESEHNVRSVLGQAEAMAPCVLWIDEIEKGLASDGSGVADGGVSRRLLGTILTWMAERTAKVFLVATANDVTQLPPELLRKGRIDEIFFVDLPGDEERREIFEIHMEKRHLQPRFFDMAQLVEASNGFSGAEIEQAIVAASYSALALKRPVDTAVMLQEIQATRPLSVVMAEKIDGLRRWAAQRTVPAN